MILSITGFFIILLTGRRGGFILVRWIGIPLIGRGLAQRDAEKKGLLQDFKGRNNLTQCVKRDCIIYLDFDGILFYTERGFQKAQGNLDICYFHVLNNNHWQKRFPCNYVTWISYFSTTI